MTGGVQLTAAIDSGAVPALLPGAAGMTVHFLPPVADVGPLQLLQLATDVPDPLDVGLLRDGVIEVDVVEAGHDHLDGLVDGRLRRHEDDACLGRQQLEEPLLLVHRTVAVRDEVCDGGDELGVGLDLLLPEPAFVVVLLLSEPALVLVRAGLRRSTPRGDRGDDLSGGGAAEKADGQRNPDRGGHAPASRTRLESTARRNFDPGATTYST